MRSSLSEIFTSFCCLSAAIMDEPLYSAKKSMASKTGLSSFHSKLSASPQRTPFPYGVEKAVAIALLEDFCKHYLRATKLFVHLFSHFCCVQLIWIKQT